MWRLRSYRSETARGSYKKTKEILLNAYADTKGGIGFRVVTAERKKGQSGSQFMTQLYRQCRQWWQDLSVDEAAVKYTMAVTELQLPLACRNYVQVRNPTSIHQMSTYIESFFVEGTAPRMTTLEAFQATWLPLDISPKVQRRCSSKR